MSRGAARWPPQSVIRYAASHLGNLLHPVAVRVGRRLRQEHKNADRPGLAAGDGQHCHKTVLQPRDN